METKKCCMCKEDLPIDRFKSNSSKKGGLQYQCIECQKKYRRDHYEKNRQKYIDKAALYKKNASFEFNLLKLTLKCKLCGESHVSCLQFHHTDKNEKEFSICEMISMSKERMKIEIEKCVVLCANCHFKLHYDERNVGVAQWQSAILPSSMS